MIGCYSIHQSSKQKTEVDTFASDSQPLTSLTWVKISGATTINSTVLGFSNVPDVFSHNKDPSQREPFISMCFDLLVRYIIGTNCFCDKHTQKMEHKDTFIFSEVCIVDIHDVIILNGIKLSKKKKSFFCSH